MTENKDYNNKDCCSLLYSRLRAALKKAESIVILYSDSFKPDIFGQQRMSADNAEVSFYSMVLELTACNEEISDCSEKLLKAADESEDCTAYLSGNGADNAAEYALCIRTVADSMISAASLYNGYSLNVFRLLGISGNTASVNVAELRRQTAVYLSGLRTALNIINERIR